LVAGENQNSEDTQQQLRSIVAISILTEIDDTDPKDYIERTRAFTKIVRRHVLQTGGLIVREFSGHVLACLGHAAGNESDVTTAAFLAHRTLRAVTAATPDIECKIGLSFGTALVRAPNDQNAALWGISGAVLRTSEDLSRRGAPGQILIDTGAQRMISSALQLGPEHDETQARGIEFNLSPNETAPADPLVEPRHALVGRDAEVEHLTNSLRQALDGQGSVVSLRVEPGEGKSRLVHETSKVAIDLGFDVEVFQGHQADANATIAPLLTAMFRDGAFANEGALNNWRAKSSPTSRDAAAYFSLLVGTAPQMADAPPRGQHKGRRAPSV